MALGVVPMFHITGMMYSVLGSVLRRLDAGADAALGPRTRRAADLAPPRDALDLHPDDDHRPVRQPELQELRPVEPALPQRRRRGDAARGGASACSDEFGLTFAEGYGLTETAAPSHANPPERAKLQCLGIPIFGVDSRVVDPITLEELPPGEVGEIITHGPMVFKGYWRHPEATAAAFVELRRHARSSAPATSAAWTRRATSSSPTA